MARYIDADKFTERIKVSPAFHNTNDGLLLQRVVIDLLNNMPTADAAPKSEVERLEAELDDLKRDTIPKLQYGLQRANTMGRDLEVEVEAMRTAANSYKMHYESLAREIFEEIESICIKHIDRYNRYIMCCEEFAELKKKYIGGKTDEDISD